MARQLVLLVDSHPARLQGQHEALRRAGYWPLPAPTVSRARDLLRKVRVALVVSAAQLDDGHSAVLLDELRSTAHTEHLPLAVLGPLTADEQRTLTRDAQVYVWEPATTAALVARVAEVVGHPDGE